MNKYTFTFKYYQSSPHTHTHLVKAAANRKMLSPDIKVYSVVVKVFPTWWKYCIKLNLFGRRSLDQGPWTRVPGLGPLVQGPWTRAPGGFFVSRGPLGLLSSASFG